MDSGGFRWIRTFRKGEIVREVWGFIGGGDKPEVDSAQPPQLFIILKGKTRVCTRQAGANLRVAPSRILRGIVPATCLLIMPKLPPPRGSVTFLCIMTEHSLDVEGEDE